jgi:hypothetical protein
VTSWFAEKIQQGGPGALTVLYLTLPALGASTFHAIAPRKWAAWLGAGIVALAIAGAASGYFDSTSRSDRAVETRRKEGTPPAELDDMHERGYLEARVPLEFAGVLAGACAVPLIIGEVRRRSRRA